MEAALDADRLQRELEAIFGPRRVSLRPVDLDTYARDMWPRMLLGYREGKPLPARPYAVVWPEHVREVIAVIKLAREQRIPIVPYGGGSGVCGGAVPIHGGITIDTKRMQQIRAVHAAELVCDVEAGLSGERFERELARRGYTFGHFPSSIYCSTVGGWLATRAAGQLSTKYGKGEDRCAALTRVPARGGAAVDQVRQGRGSLRRAHRGHRARRGDRDQRAEPRAARAELDPAAARQRGHARADHLGPVAAVAGAPAAGVPRLRGRGRGGRAGRDPPR